LRRFLSKREFWGRKKPPDAGQSCERLAQVALPNAKITLAKLAVAGSFNSYDGGKRSGWPATRRSTGRCLRFAEWRLRRAPSADFGHQNRGLAADRGVEWKISRGAGTGDFAGRDRLSRALAVAIHEGLWPPRGQTQAMPRPGRTAAGGRSVIQRKITDFGYRAIHEMTQNAKTVIKAFLWESPAAFVFCELFEWRAAGVDGGRSDFPGGTMTAIVAGAPANFWTHLLTSAVWDAQATTSEEASYIPPSKLQAIAICGE